MKRRTGASRKAWAVGQKAAQRALTTGKTPDEARRTGRGTRKRVGISMAAGDAGRSAGPQYPDYGDDRVSALGSTMITADNPERIDATETVTARRGTRRYVRLGGSAGRAGVHRDPALSIAYWIRAKLNARIAPAKILDPKTGAVRGYQDPITRRVSPTWPPGSDSPQTPNQGKG
jgi:hypothetical protein